MSILERMHMTTCPQPVSPPPATLQLLRIEEAAEYLRVHSQTLRRWVRLGRINAYRVGCRDLRFRRSDLDSVLELVEVKAG